MRAVVATKAGDVSVLQEKRIPKPEVRARDLLVAVKAVSVNPVDTKVRGGAFGPVQDRVLGWDACGVVGAVGPEVRGFKVGDRVYFSGDCTRAGCNAEFVAVDERLVAHAPSKLSDADAASIPLVALTAWEGLTDCMGLHHHHRLPERPKKSILVIGGAGGLGSMVVQMAKHFSLTVIATASRPESAAKAKEWGADFVIPHAPLKEELQKIGLPQVDYIFCTAPTEQYASLLGDIIRPLGHIVFVLFSAIPLPLADRALFMKRCSLHLEFMFSKSMQGVELESQGAILRHVAELLDKGDLHPRVTRTLNLWTELPAAHRALEAGQATGKIVLTL